MKIVLVSDGVSLKGQGGLTEVADRIIDEVADNDAGVNVFLMETKYEDNMMPGEPWRLDSNWGEQYNMARLLSAIADLSNAIITYEQYAKDDQYDVMSTEDIFVVPDRVFGFNYNLLNNDHKKLITDAIGLITGRHNIFVVWTNAEATTAGGSHAKYKRGDDIRPVANAIKEHFGLNVANPTILLSDVRRIFLDNGFKLKRQESGEMELNSYVYDAASALMNEVGYDIVDDMGLFVAEECGSLETDNAYLDGDLEINCADGPQEPFNNLNESE